jgi:hypothetical protein
MKKFLEIAAFVTIFATIADAIMLEGLPFIKDYTIYPLYIVSLIILCASMLKIKGTKAMAGILMLTTSIIPYYTYSLIGL